jgi:hypothetical protein
MIYIGIPAKQWSEFNVNEPCNLRMRMGLPDGCNSGKRMNDLAERSRIDDQD